MRARLRHIPRPLLALLAVALLEAVAWAYVVPALQGPDEIAHFSYTQRLVETRELPQDVENRFPFSTEVGMALAYGNLNVIRGNVAARPFWTELEEKRWREVDAKLPGGARSDGQGPNSARNNPPLYYAYEALPYLAAYEGSFFDRFYLMRLASSVFLLATVALTWLIAAELLGGALWIRTLAAGVVALHPLLAYIAGSINPDSLLAAIWSAFVLVAVRLLKHGFTRGRMLALAATCAGSLLTHPRGLALLLPAAVALGLAWRRHRPPIRRGVVLVLAGLAAVAGAVVAYLAVVRGSGGVDGGPVSSAAQAPFQVRQFLSYVWQFYLPKLPSMDPMIGPEYGWETAFVERFYGIFASLEVFYPDSVYTLLRWLSLAGLAGLVAALVARRGEVRLRWDVLVMLVVLVGALLLSLHFAAYRALLIDPGDPVIVGRYILPLMPLFGCAIAFVVASLPRRAGPYVAAALLAGGAILQLAGLGLTAARFYA
jgi:hypothetical protein